MKNKKLNSWEMLWKPQVGFLVQVFEDPMTEHIQEGIAKIVKIHKHDKFKNHGVLDCDVRFKGETEVVRRQVRYAIRHSGRQA